MTVLWPFPAIFLPTTYEFTIQKINDQTVILRCLTNLNLNWYKRFWPVFYLFLCSDLLSPHLKIHNFSEKTKQFRCPSGYKFYTKSKDLKIKTVSTCSIGSCSWSTRPNGCSASIFTTLMNKQFEVIIINLNSYKQKLITF